MKSDRVLIAGCGFLCQALARQLTAEGCDVLGVVHSSSSADALRGESFKVTSGDFTNRADVASWGKFDAVVHAGSSGRGDAEAYRRIYLDGVQTLAEVLKPPYLLFVSSTSVYAQIDGEWVTEESPAEPSRETGRHLRAAEEVAIAHGGAAARLAGLYGPRRSVLLKKFLSGDARLEAGGSRWINQIHRDDAAAALAVLLRARTQGICNVADGTPLTQRELYTGLSERLQRPLPPEGVADFNRKRGWTHKRVANGRLRSLGWAPRYPSFFAALEHDPQLLPAALEP